MESRPQSGLARTLKAAWPTLKTSLNTLGERWSDEVVSELLPTAANRLAALPASPPTPATPTSAHQPKQQKKHHRANKGVDDQGKDPGAKMDADLRQ
jgi:hypothetical protein